MSKILRGKGLADSAKAIAFSRVSRRITAAAREGVALNEALQEAKRIKKEAEEAEKIARDEIARHLLTNEIGLINGVQVVSWKQQAGKKSLDLVALRSEYPEVVAQFERDGFPYRVMRIKGKKETK
jgi:hypothetical protein